MNEFDDEPYDPPIGKATTPQDMNRPPVRQAMADLAQRLGVDQDDISLLEVREVVWPDASLGCPQPGQVYAQEAQPGLLIRLSAGGSMYFYHSSVSQSPFLCEASSQLVPRVTPKEDEFVPPPDFEID